MIGFADDSMLPALRNMWKVSFGDEDAYLDIFFSCKYRADNTLVYLEDDEPVASLYLIPYTITFYGQEVSFMYLMGLSTLPQYRNKGYMKMLIEQAHQLMRERGIALSILVPADEWLFDYYARLGYQQISDKGDELVTLKRIIDENVDIEDAYSAFDRQYRHQDFCVQKTQLDFEAIVKEYKLDGCPNKYNLGGMAKIIDVWSLLRLYAEANLNTKLSIEIEGDSTYLICDGWVEAVDGLMADLKITQELLCRLLFGYHIDEMGDRYKKYFSEHSPIINLMLE